MLTGSTLRHPGLFLRRWVLECPQLGLLLAQKAEQRLPCRIVLFLSQPLAKLFNIEASDGLKHQRLVLCSRGVSDGRLAAYDTVKPSGCVNEVTVTNRRFPVGTTGLAAHQLVGIIEYSSDPFGLRRRAVCDIVM